MFSFAATGVPGAVNAYDDVYKLRWTTTSTAARRVALSVMTTGYGYRAGADGVNVADTVTDTIFIDFVGSGCPCELDGTAGVTVFDLLDYLSLWFALDPAADIDGTPGVNVFDLLEFLDCWFPASAGGPCP